MAQRCSPQALAIFRDVIEDASASRADLLVRVGEACEGDDALRTEVLWLIDADSSKMGFLDQPVARVEPSAVADAVSDCWAPGQSFPLADCFGAVPPEREPTMRMRGRLGQFALLRRIASGGSGTVYEAVQSNPTRRVALKLLRVAATDAAVVRRFLDEASILARLRHRGIATVHASGIDEIPVGDDIEGVERVAYIAIELVESARTITSWCSETRLDLRGRLSLFAEVCDAVQHAHQNCVIHRDLKPANLLVGADGVPKVIDFGVARLVDADEGAPARTRQGQMVGTIGYMAPEQLSSGTGDARCDVYGLGVVLYQLVCGRLPHDVASRPLAEAVQRVCGAPIPRPGTIDPAVPCDVEAIAMKALERDPDRRYSSVAALADDVRRFLDLQPVTARPSTAVHALSLFARRNRALASVGALASVLVVAAMAFAAMHWRRAVLARCESVTLREAQAAALNTVTRQVGPDGRRSLQGFLFAPLTQEERVPDGGVVVSCLPRASGAPAPLVVADASGRAVRSDDLLIEVPASISPRAAGTQPFALVDAFVADVIPDHPGRELVATLVGVGPKRAQRELSVMRVYDLSLHPLREAWTTGRFTSMVWNERAQLVVATIDAYWLQYFDPRLAAYDVAQCGATPTTLSAVVGLSPQAIRGVILPLEGPYLAPDPTTDPRAAAAGPARWTLVRRPSELEGPGATGTIGSVRLEPPAPGDDPSSVCRVIETREAPPRDGRAPAVEGAISFAVDEAGRCVSCAADSTAAYGFVVMDAQAMVRGRAVADSALRASGDLAGALASVLEAGAIDREVRRGAVARLEALGANWRWLNAAADAVCTDDPDMMAFGDPESALAWVGRALDLHGARCPSGEECRVAWYLEDTLGHCQFRHGLFADALATMIGAEALWKARMREIAPHAAGEVAIQAMCHEHLGDHERAVAELRRARAEFATSVSHGGATERLLEEAEQVVGSGSPSP